MRTGIQHLTQSGHKNAVSQKNIEGPKFRSDLDLDFIFAFFESQTGSAYAFNFPSNWNTETVSPAMSFERNEAGGFKSPTLIENFKLGAMRDWRPLQTSEPTGNQYVLVDHGVESGSYDEWPHGHIYVAQEVEGSFTFNKITEKKAFYHSVSVGDINSDGLPDIIASNMGSNFGATSQDIHAFIQDENGSFYEDLSIADAMGDTNGTGAIEAVRLPGDQTGIVEAAYGRTFGEEYAIRVFSGSTSKGFEVVQQKDRMGLFETMGATRVRVADLDRDGKEDLIISLEGTLQPNTSGYTANGLEIFKTDFEDTIQRTTDEWLAGHAWSFEQLQFREFEIVDFDFDGWKDIVLHPTGGKSLDTADSESVVRDLGSVLLRNVEGKQFEPLTGIDISSTNLDNSVLGFSGSRFVSADPESGTFEFLTTAKTYEEEQFLLSSYFSPDYRNSSEALELRQPNDTVFGFGGDDAIISNASGGLANGGAGFDTVIYEGSREDYIVTKATGGWTVGRHEGVRDRVTDVELIQFSDIAIGLDPDGHAAQAMRLYQASFDRAPDLEGLGYWVRRLDGGADLERAASEFIESPEFSGRYGDALTNNKYVDALYDNILDRELDDGGNAYWVNRLSDDLTKPDVLARFSESNENKENTADLMMAGVEYVPYDLI